jgi:hypothetical protein
MTGWREGARAWLYDASARRTCQSLSA